MFETNESDNESQSELQSQALPVAELKNVNFDVPPITGEEYLLRVRLEASKLPKVVIANVSPKQIQQKTQFSELTKETTLETPSEYLADLEWQRKTCADFANLRIQVDKNRESFKQNKKAKLPHIDNKKEWFKYFFTQTESNENNEPLLSILYNMSQTTILKLFDYHVEWFNEFEFNELASKWLFSLMTFIEKPLLPETYHSLRQLARRCIYLRAKLTQTQKETCLNSLNLLITLVGRYFEQYDLADSFS
jgi:hypothetical protein